MDTADTVLVRPSPEHEEAFRAFTNEFKAAGEPVIPSSARQENLSYREWLENALLMETEAPSHLVTAHTLFLTDGEGRDILGVVHIRHRLTDYLLKAGGHIGYGVRPSRRGEGLATRMLALALPVARELGIGRVLVTCDRTNPASAAVIRKNGGVLENEVEDNGVMIQRYWIEPE